MELSRIRLTRYQTLPLIDSSASQAQARRKHEMNLKAKTSRETSMKIRLFALFSMFGLLQGGLQLRPAYAQQNVPEIKFDSVPDFPTLPPGMNFAEVPGVAVNSKTPAFSFTPPTNTPHPPTA